MIPERGIEKLVGLTIENIALRDNVTRRRGANFITIGLSNIIGGRSTELRDKTKNFIWVHIIVREGGRFPAGSGGVKGSRR